MDLAFDIETVADPDLPQKLLDKLYEGIESEFKRDSTKIEKKLELRGTFGLKPMTGRIASIGYHTILADGSALEGVLIDEDERKILSDFWHLKDRLKQEKVLPEFEQIRLISFNGKAFDAPFIKVRSAKHRILPKFLLDTKRYDTRFHFDVREVLTNFDQREKGKLDDWAAFFGVGGKTSDGGHVQVMWDSKQFKELAEYNLEDCRITYKLFLHTEAYW